MSGAQVIVAYPRKDGATFNKDYYLKTHMPLAAKHWKKHGLKSYAVTEMGPDAPYTITVVIEFDSIEGFGAAVKDPNTKEVLDDVENFSSEKAVIMAGPVIERVTV